LGLDESHPAVQRLVDAESDIGTGIPNASKYARDQDTYEGHASLDLAGLKRINDVISHDAGDQFLRQSAQIMRE
jgi:GGDEF domain-containing protein